jgi:Flp pilus assembly protein TadG
MTDESRRGEQGQALVEFAIILPIVLLLVVGMIQVGIAFNYWINLNQLSAEGARWVAVDRLPGNPDPTVADYEAYIRDQVLTADLRDKLTDPGTGEVTGVDVCLVDTTEPQVGDAVRVRIQAPYSLAVVSDLMKLGARLFGGDDTGVGDVTLSGSSTVRLEQPPSAPSPGLDPC